MSDLSQFATAFLNIFDRQQPDESCDSVGSLSIEDAYRVQRMVIDQRIRRGEQRVGYKVGCTSEAIRRQFGLTQPIRGFVMAPHFYHGDTRLNRADYCQPAVEPEFVLTMGRDCNDEVSDHEPLDDAIDFVSAGIELHNYRFWFGEPTIQELIASNGIHAALIVGEQKVKPQQVDWQTASLEVFRNGRMELSGPGSDIMGGAMNSLRWLINHLVRCGEMLKAGDVVIPGSPVELMSVDQGDTVTVHVSHVGRIEAVFD